MQEDKDKLDDFSYSTLQFGVWRMLVPIPDAANKLPFMQSWLEKWNNFKSAIPIVQRFFLEVYSLDPILYLLYSLLRVVSAVEGTLMLYASAQLLSSVEHGLTTGRPDVAAIIRAVLLRVMCTALTTAIRWGSTQINPKAQSRFAAHFEEYMLHAKLRLDLPTSTDKNNDVGVSPWVLWWHFQTLSGVFERALRLTSQILFTLKQPKGGIVLTMLSMISPLLSSQLTRVPWKHGFVTYSSNLDFIRLRALRWLSGSVYREDVISSNIIGWIIKEYRKAKDSLGDTPDSNPESQFLSRNTPMSDILTQVTNDLPTFYWAASVIRNPVGFSVSSFAILQQHANALRGSIFELFGHFAEAAEVVTAIKDLYKLADIKNKVVDGEEAYPNAATSTAKGMALELRDVSFAYPGTKSKENAIKNVSLKIPAGHLVVIVGANGSGKSTIIKLLNRLYDVDAGEILVDGLPMKNYKLADLRKAQALLSQDHQLFPLSLAENIGLGDPDRVNDMKLVLEAAEAGGASEVIKKMNDGIQTVLYPVTTAYGTQLEKYPKLQSILENLEQQAEVSGGEKQRLVAARTFMRFLSGNIRFAVADEPSSALDPKAEYQLFKRLRESGEGKTMIFYADMIICMKDGHVVETGTHKELMGLAGEYSELYNVQAQAFSDASNP
ncbi:P-loop containing nucleoside triphosphate hydrolase protein [Favolaschia claudopus]|uniref:P-loop containing nucleoside triphosphate hydrolase protein n=1 Tax=Favolaschia claudopus TaxID=2862362 RepID=A0AAW0DW17_9AGAR